GPGYKEERMAVDVGGFHPGRKQPIHNGSYVVVPRKPALEQLRSFTLQVLVWPTTPEKGRQSLIAWWDDGAKRGFVLGIDETAGLSFRIGDGSGSVEEVASGTPLLAREWYLAAASFDAETGEVRLYQQPLVDYGSFNPPVEVTKAIALKP